MRDDGHVSVEGTILGATFAISGESRYVFDMCTAVANSMYVIEKNGVEKGMQILSYFWEANEKKDGLVKAPKDYYKIDYDEKPI